MANTADTCVRRPVKASDEADKTNQSRTVWGTFFETLNGMEEINLKKEGYDQLIFRAYAPGK
jgi:hypothetical protein